MNRNLIVVFGAVLAFVLGLAIYHLSAVNRLDEQPLPLFHGVDAAGQLTVQDVIKGKIAFAPMRQRRFNVGYTEAVHWLRFRLSARGQAQERSFEIRNPTIDRLELFEFKNGQVRSLGLTGSRLPFAQRPSPTKTFVYLLDLQPGETVDYYLRIDKRHENLATEFALSPTSDFEDREQREYFLWGIFIGVVGLVVLLAFLLFRTTRDPVYVWFGVVLIGLALRQLADTGLGFQYLWPRLPTLNQPDPVIEALWIYVPAMIQFQQYFLDLRRQSRRLFQFAQAIKWAFWLALVVLIISQLLGVNETFVDAPQLIRWVHGSLTNLAYIVFIAVTIRAMRSGDEVQRVYGLGFAIQYTGQLFVIIQNVMGFRANGVFFVDAYLILTLNFFIDLVVFTYLLAYRYRKTRDEEQALQLSLAQNEQQTNNAIIDLLEAERQQVGALLVRDVSGRLIQTRAQLAHVQASPLLVNANLLIARTDQTLDQILRDSLPPDLMQKGLSASLAHLIEQRNQTGMVHLVYQHHDDQPGHPLTIAETHHLYRMANELINNVLKHAEATVACLTLDHSPAGWQLTVSDNGRGFAVDASPDGGGIGLKNLRARAQALGADLHIESNSAGTTVTIQIR